MEIYPFENRISKRIKDVSMRCFFLPKVFLTYTYLWPTKFNSRARKIAICSSLILMLHLEAAQFMYLFLEQPDITHVTIIMSTLSTTLQGIMKTIFMYIYSRRLRIVLDQVFLTFWPSNLMGKEMEVSLKRTSTFVQFSMICIMCSAAIFAGGFLSKPLIDGSREIPFLTWYPFDWRLPGVYETVYVVQVITNLFFIVWSILGHDFLFFALSANIIAQFRLLGKVIDNLCSGNDGRLDKILSSLEGATKERPYSDEESLLKKIISHHNKLLFICKELNVIFSPTLFVQLATSVVAICVSSFLLTAVDEIKRDMVYQLTSYCLGHVLQLFIICAAGSEMAYQSEQFCINAYTCYWYRKKYSNIRKALTLVILRAQRAVKVTALGIFEMNYATFIAVMRLSFSFYTLLTEIIEEI